MNKPLVIYHGNCADGFSAAWCFWNKYGEDFEYFAGHYGKSPPIVMNRNVYLVDFSYKRDVIEMMLGEVRNLYFIDHHISAINDLAGIDNPRFHRYVDVNKSGAKLAWEWVYGDAEPPMLLSHIEDRDLWRFRLPNTKEIQSTVFSYDYTFEQWDRLMSAGPVELLEMTASGAALMRKHMKDINELLGVCLKMDYIGGHLVPIANLPYTMSSEAGAIMAVGHPFAACYMDTKDGRTFSLRSEPGKGIDVSLIASRYGGGGHKHASGFKVLYSHELARI